MRVICALGEPEAHLRRLRARDDVSRAPSGNIRGGPVTCGSPAATFPPIFRNHLLFLLSSEASH